MSQPKPMVVHGVAGVEPAAGGTSRWPEPTATPDRHGAISRQLGSYSNYRSWAEKMKSSFEPAAPALPDPRAR